MVSSVSIKAAMWLMSRSGTRCLERKGLWDIQYLQAQLISLAPSWRPHPDLLELPRWEGPVRTQTNHTIPWLGHSAFLMWKDKKNRIKERKKVKKLNSEVCLMPSCYSPLLCRLTTWVSILLTNKLSSGREKNPVRALKKSRQKHF